MATLETKNVVPVRLRRRPEMVTAQELIDYARRTSDGNKLADDIALLLREYVNR